MQTKALEIRDRATLIPALAVNMVAGNPAQARLLAHAGYSLDGLPNIALTDLAANGRPTWNDPYAWSGRTFPAAHHYIINNWNEIKDGDVIDVEFILGETTEKKTSEVQP